MLLFSAKTRELLDFAVNRLSDASQRQIWQVWAKEHLHVRVPNGPAEDDEPPLPAPVVDVALLALLEMATV